MQHVKATIHFSTAQLWDHLTTTSWEHHRWFLPKVTHPLRCLGAFTHEEHVKTFLLKKTIHHNLCQFDLFLEIQTNFLPVQPSQLFILLGVPLQILIALLLATIPLMFFSQVRFTKWWKNGSFIHFSHSSCKCLVTGPRFSSKNHLCCSAFTPSCLHEVWKELNVRVLQGSIQAGPQVNETSFQDCLVGEQHKNSKLTAPYEWSTPPCGSLSSEPPAQTLQV